MTNALSVRRGGMLTALATLLLALMLAATALPRPAAAEPGDVLASGEFERKRKNTSGAFEIVETADGRVLRLADNFSTGRGPDIKIFLSPLPFADASGDNATQGSILLGQLDSRRGAAELVIPADVDLSAFQSVLVHCEEFSVLFGGADL